MDFWDFPKNRYKTYLPLWKIMNFKWTYGPNEYFKEYCRLEGAVQIPLIVVVVLLFYYKGNDRKPVNKIVIS